MAMAMWGGCRGSRAHQDPLLANSMWCACRIRWHSQLKVPVEEIRKLVRSHSAADLPSGEAKLGAPPTGTAASDNEEVCGTVREAQSRK